MNYPCRGPVVTARLPFVTKSNRGVRQGGGSGYLLRKFQIPYHPRGNKVFCYRRTARPATGVKGAVAGCRTYLIFFSGFSVARLRGARNGWAPALFYE